MPPYNGKLQMSATNKCTSDINKKLPQYDYDKYANGPSAISSACRFKRVSMLQGDQINILLQVPCI